MNSLQGSLALSLAFAFASCKDSPKSDVTHHEVSEAETNRAIQEAFIQPVGDKVAETPPGITSFFNKLSKATRSSADLSTSSFLSIDAIVSSSIDSGELDNLSAKQMRGLRTALNKSTPLLGKAIKQMAFDDFKISLVETIDDDQVLVYIRLYDNELNVVTQMRWWMIETSQGWLCYDFEDLSMGLRSFTLMTQMISLSSGNAKPPWIDAFIPVGQFLQQIDDDNVESYSRLKAPLQKLMSHKLPLHIRSFASSMLATVHMAEENNELALAELEKAKTGGYLTPLGHYQRGNALLLLERNHEALEAFQVHMKKLGRDCDSLELVSDCYLAMKQPEKARAAALEGLSDNPSSTNCAICLAAASTPAQIAEPTFFKYIEGTPIPEDTFEYAIDYLIELDLKPQTEAVFQLLKKKMPTSELIEHYEETFAKSR